MTGSPECGRCRSGRERRSFGEADRQDISADVGGGFIPASAPCLPGQAAEPGAGLAGTAEGVRALVDCLLRGPADTVLARLAVYQQAQPTGGHDTGPRLPFRILRVSWHGRCGVRWPDRAILPARFKLSESPGQATEDFPRYP